jgi:hypothetical protein
MQEALASALKRIDYLEARDAQKFRVEIVQRGKLSKEFYVTPHGGRLTLDLSALGNAN